MLKSIHKPTHLRNFAGQTLGIDAYGWLHRGTVSCAIELAQQKPTRKHIEFALNRVRMLIYFGVKPYVVFDGDYLPSKAHTEKERAARRKECKRAGLELLRMGKVSQAHLELQKAIDVTPLMARELIEELKQLDVPYVVAPYEADSQLAYLEKNGIISGVISEDSDMLVFGVKCLLTKLDQHGECIMINRADFTACREISLVGWSDHEFRMMSMLSGCDYLPGIDKMGLKTAYRLVRKHKTFDRVVRMVQFDGKMKVPAGYAEDFARAERTFLYQWVYCPRAQCLVNLNAVPSNIDLDSMPYIGKADEPEVAAAIAAGDLDPNTKQRLVPPSRQSHSAARNSFAQTPDEKQGKPISEFFKSMRKPLAELDPNSFTPSPSQQRLLETQQATSWSASQAPAARLPSLDRNAMQSAPSSAPLASRRTLSDQQHHRRRVSPKRQRLCTDSMLASSMDGSVGLKSATSRFFPKDIAEPSPSMRKASTQKKQDDFELWSDDSIANAVASVAAAVEIAPATQAPSLRKRKKVAVYVDAAQGEVTDRRPGATEIAGDSRESAGDQTTANTQEAQDADVPLTSFDTPASQSAENVFTKGIDTGFAALKTKFLHKPPGRKLGRTISAPLSSGSPLDEVERNQLLGRLAEVTAPQKLHRQTTAPPNDQEAVPCSSPVADQVESQADDEIEDEEWLAMESRPASSDPPIPVRGSEDLLVPNSPASEGDDGRLKPKLDLGRFTFAG